MFLKRNFKHYTRQDPKIYGDPTRPEWKKTQPEPTCEISDPTHHSLKVQSLVSEDEPRFGTLEDSRFGFLKVREVRDLVFSGSFQV